MKFVLLILMICSISAEGFSRGGAAAQRGLNNAVAPLRRCVRNLSPQLGELPVEVFQGLDLPLNYFRRN